MSMNKTFTIAQATLNDHAVHYVDTMITATDAFPQTSGKTIGYVPRRIQVINKTGQDVKVNIFSTSGEYTRYVGGDTTNADLWTIASNTYTNIGAPECLPNAYKMAVQMPTGSASADLIIECISYNPYPL